MFNDILGSKGEEKRYRVKVIIGDGSSHIIKNVVLIGEYWDLAKKLKDVRYIKALGIHESLILKSFKLVEVK